MTGRRDSARGRSASPKPLHEAQAAPLHRKNAAMRSRSPSRSYRSRSRGSAHSYSRSRSRDRSRPMSISRSPEPRSPSDSAAPRTALSISNLSKNVRETHLRQIFAWYGKVLNVYVPPEPRASAAESYVVFSSVQEAAKAVLYMGKGQIDGVAIEVNTCAPPPDLAQSRPDARPNWTRDDRYPATDLRSRFGPRRDPEPRRRSPPRHQQRHYDRGQASSSFRPRSPAQPSRNRSRSPYRSTGRKPYTNKRASPSYT